MSISGKKIMLQPGAPRAALTDSNSKSTTANGAKGHPKGAAASGVPKVAELSEAKPSAAAAEKDAILRECLRKLVGKRVPLLKLLNAADVNPQVASPPYFYEFMHSSSPPDPLPDTRMWHHIPAAAEKVSRHTRLRSVAGSDQRAHRHRSSGR